MRKRRQERILRELLEQDDYQWRKLSTLAKAVGETGADGLQRVRGRLTSIGARPSQSRTRRELWGLTSRVGVGRQS